MALRIFWTQFAKDKLNEIFQRSCLKNDWEYAQNLVTKISLHSKIKTSRYWPKINITSKTCIFLIYKKYKIVYWVNTELDCIEIVNVFDCLQNPHKIMEM